MLARLENSERQMPHIGLPEVVLVWINCLSWSSGMSGILGEPGGEQISFEHVARRIEK